MEVIVAESSWHLSTNQLFELLKKAKEDSSAAAARRLRLMMHDFRGDAEMLAKSVSFFMLQCSLAERLNTLLSQIKAAAVTYLWPFPGFSRLNAVRCI